MVSSKREWIIGRAPHCDIIVEQSHVSRQHARLSLTEHGVVVTDLGGTAGTTVNGQRIHGPTPVGPGDVIRLGSTPLDTSREPLRSIFQRATHEHRQADEEQASATKGVGPALWIMGGLVFTVVLTLIIVFSGPKGDGSDDDDDNGDYSKAPGWVYDAIFMIAVQCPKGDYGVGTGFVVRGPQVIVTNAHVAEGIRDFPISGCTPFVVQNEHPDNRLQVVNSTIHPGFVVSKDKEQRPDVAYLEVSDPKMLPRGLRMADMKDFSKENLRDQTVKLVGFPTTTGSGKNEFLNSSEPSASILEGKITNVISNNFLQHDAKTSPGTSGSPIILPKKNWPVVGVNWGGDTVAVPNVDKNGRVVGWTRMPSGTGIKWGVGLPVLKPFLDGLR